MWSHMAVSPKTVYITDGCLSLVWSGIYHVLLHARDCIDAEACGLLGWCLLNQSSMDTATVCMSLHRPHVSATCLRHQHHCVIGWVISWLAGWLAGGSHWPS